MRNSILGIAALFLFAAQAGDIPAEPLRVRFVTFNVNFNNTAQEIRDDVQAAATRADIMMLQEAKFVIIDNFLGAEWTVVQVTDQTDAKQGAAIAIRNSIMIQKLAQGLRFGVDNHGEQMHDRYITWADLKLTNGLTLRVMSLHLPPKRFEYLQPIMADNFAEFVGETPYRIVAGGDWNFNVNDDPLNIEEMTGLVPQGRGIDGFYYSEEAVEVTAMFRLAGLEVNSDHDPVQMITNVQTVESRVGDWALYD